MTDLPKFKTCIGEETAEQIRKRFITQCDQISSLMLSGCTDGNCQIRPRKGMHTNGGCKCWRYTKDALKSMAEDVEQFKYGRGRCY